MPILSFQNETISCDRAQKGKDYIRLLDGNGNVVFFADGISDFSGYTLSDGEWEATPYVVMAPTVGAVATASGGIITLATPKSVKIENGLQVNFTAPCDCSVTEYLRIGGENYTVVDSLGRCVTGKGGLWVAGAVLSVTLDVDKKFAYIQSARGGLVLDETAEQLGIESGATIDNALVAMNTVMSGKSVSAVGSYVGTGAAEFALAFDFEPELLMIQNTGARTYPIGELVDTSGSAVVTRGDTGITFVKGCTTYPIKAVYIRNSDSVSVHTNTDITVGFNGKGVEWSAPATSDDGSINPASVFNAEGVTYFYFAIGKGAIPGVAAYDGTITVE